MRIKTMVEEATAHQGISAGSGRAACIKPSRGAGHPPLPLGSLRQTQRLRCYVKSLLLIKSSFFIFSTP